MANFKHSAPSATTHKWVCNSKKILITLGLFFLIIVFNQVFSAYTRPADDAVSYYQRSLTLLKKSLQDLRKHAESKTDRTTLMKDFQSSRLVYKKIAVLIEFLNPYDSRILNGPAIPRLESEMVDRIIPPQGYQAIEQLIYADWKADSHEPLILLIDEMLQTIKRLEKEPDLQYKFKKELLWDASRSALVSIVTNGLTGFDSPVANYSIPEARASLDGIREIVLLLKKEIPAKQTASHKKTLDLVAKAKSYLTTQTTFNKFDRLHFITGYINPLYKQWVTLRIESGIGVPEGRSFVNYNSKSFFAEDALELNFYSPSPEYWVTSNRVKLGKLLFSDPILSGNNERSCATCHKPELAFTDGLKKPYAIDNITLLTRNTPTLWNAGFQTKQFHDSRTDILENQLGEVVHNIEEMQGSLGKSVKDLERSDKYRDLFKEAYPNDKNPINTFTIANSIASYIRSLRSFNSRFDQYVRGDKTKLNSAERNGFNLFAGKAKCATCHFIPLFNGVVPPLFSETESEVLGVPASPNKKDAVLDEDPGKYDFTKAELHKHSFKTPTLRNIALTAPYMHNGVFNTLEDVMEFYNNGGGTGLGIAPENQTLPFDKLNLSKKEIGDIIQFMKALTDTSWKMPVIKP